jgi:hypothetical protein
LPSFQESELDTILEKIYWDFRDSMADEDPKDIEPDLPRIIRAIFIYEKDNFDIDRVAQHFGLVPETVRKYIRPLLPPFPLDEEAITRESTPESTQSAYSNIDDYTMEINLSTPGTPANE